MSEKVGIGRNRSESMVGNVGCTYGGGTFNTYSTVMMLLNIAIRVFLVSPTCANHPRLKTLCSLVYCIVFFTIHFYDRNCNVKTRFTKVYIVKRDVQIALGKMFFIYFTSRMVKVSIASRAICEHDVKKATSLHYCILNVMIIQGKKNFTWNTKQ